MFRGCAAVLALVAMSALPDSASAGSPGTVGTLVRATLTSRVPLQATPGTRFALTWTFANSQGYIDPGGGAMTIFVRLDSRDGKSTTTALAPPRPRPTSAPNLKANARYRIVVTVPRGGIGRIEIGGRMPHGVSGFFPITNDPLKH
jgi:hypothetical protein